MGENLVLVLLLALPALTGGLLCLFYRHVHLRPEPVRWPLVLLGNLLLVAFLLCGIALAGEVYFRFLYNSTDSLLFSKVSQRWFKRYYQWNGANLRDNLEYSLRIAPGKRRISFVGDSFTVGHGVKNVEDRFANRLRREHPEWEIHVLAMLGFNTGDEVDYLAGWLPKGYQLDEVVLVYCLNDIGDLIPEETAAIHQANAEAKRGGWLQKNSYLVNTLYYRWKLRRDPALKGFYDFERAAYQDGPLWEQQKQRLTVFRDLVESHGGRLAVVTFPFFHALGPNYEYGFVHKKLDAFWHGLNVPHLDLWPIYRPVPREQLIVNRYDAHPNEYAHALATPAIEKFLEEHLSPAKK
ncbi:MAG TPA: SGNH/GDSL hydrolase family protein [Candidatus Binatia bacterium]|jgi:hypothetical protein|nr:SGNH/GDSL hydrolase family protein [Candidatus Binatia bacterium]